MNDLTRELLSKQNYVDPSRYISGRIVEYDIKSANISMLYLKGIIDEENYRYLSSIPKQEREVSIGLMIKDNYNIYKAIANGIKEYRLKFGEANNITPESIVRIANDAIYLNSFIDVNQTIFDNVVEFRVKSISNVFLKLTSNIKSSSSYNIFVSFNNNGKLDISVKGLNEALYPMHTDILGVIGTTVFYLERSTPEDALNYLSNIIEMYIHRNLPLSYYREFNSESKYNILFNNARYLVNELSSNSDISYIDITYNYMILSDLWRIVLEKYNRR